MPTFAARPFREDELRAAVRGPSRGVWWVAATLLALVLGAPSVGEHRTIELAEPLVRLVGDPPRAARIHLRTASQGGASGWEEATATHFRPSEWSAPAVAGVRLFTLRPTRPSRADHLIAVEGGDGAVRMSRLANFHRVEVVATLPDMAFVRRWHAGLHAPVVTAHRDPALARAQIAWEFTASGDTPHGPYR